MSAPRLAFALVALHDAAFGVIALTLAGTAAAVIVPSALASAAVLAVSAGVARSSRTAAIVATGAFVFRMTVALAWALVARDAATAESFPVVLGCALLPAFILLLACAPGRTVVVAAALLHVAASLALVAVRGGTVAEPSLAARRDWIAANRAPWILAWTLWSASSLSFGATIAAWARPLGFRRTLVIAGAAIALAGVPLDLLGEAACVVAMTRRGVALEDFARAAETFTCCGPVAANGLYCAGGALLSTVSWRSGFLRGRSGRLGFLTWAVGFALSLSAAAAWREVSVAAGAAVMACFIPWSALLASRLGRE